MTHQKKDALYYAGWKEAIEAVCGWHEEKADFLDDSDHRRHAERILNKFLFKGKDFCVPSEKGKDMKGAQKVVGNVYAILGTHGEDGSIFADSFVACDAEVAIVKARNWAMKQCPEYNRYRIIIDDVRRIARDVIL